MRLKSGIGEKPLWSQLYEILENEISQGIYNKGDILPSEKELMEKYEVSRVTVRQAMDKLLIDGLICRSRGIGTTVIKNNNNTLGTSFKSSFKGVQEKNNSKDRRVIAIEMVIPSQEIMTYFDLKKNTKVLKLTRMTYIDSTPVTYYESYLNPIVGLDKNTDFSGSMYSKLSEQGYKIDAVKENISAAISTKDDVKLFQRKGNFAILIRIRKGYSTNLPIEYTYSKYIAEGYNLEIDLT